MKTLKIFSIKKFLISKNFKISDFAFYYKIKSSQKNSFHNNYFKKIAIINVIIIYTIN